MAATARVMRCEREIECRGLQSRGGSKRAAGGGQQAEHNARTRRERERAAGCGVRAGRYRRSLALAGFYYAYSLTVVT